MRFGTIVRRVVRHSDFLFVIQSAIHGADLPRKSALTPCLFLLLLIKTVVEKWRRWWRGVGVMMNDRPSARQEVATEPDIGYGT